MNREAKAAVIDEIAADITDSQAIFAIDYRGITVAQADQLRARLREADAVFRVVKNSLTERAAAKAGAEELLPLLQGPTALTFVHGDAAAAAKAVADFTRATQLLAFKGGLMDGASVTAGDLAAISRLPTRDVLYGQLVGLIASPLAGLARTLNALIGGLAVGLGGVLSQKESDPAFAVSDLSEATDGAAVEGDAVATDQPPGEEAAESAAAGGPSDEPAAAEEPDEANSAVAESAAASDEAVASDEAAVAEEPAGEAEAVPQDELDSAGAESAAPVEEAAADDEAAATEEPTAKTEDEAAPTASDENQTDESAPEAPSGDDDKEDQ